MIPAAGLTWRGNANELIASYAVCSSPLCHTEFDLMCKFPGWWLRTCKRYRCLCYYLWTRRIICLLWHGWSICWIRKSSMQQTCSGSLQCIGPRRTYCGISVYVGDEESCCYAPQFGGWRVWVFLLLKLFTFCLLMVCYRMYQKMIKHITAADTVLKDVDSAASEIDRVLEGEWRCH